MTTPELSPPQMVAWRWSMTLTLLRAILAPVLIVLAWQGAPGWTLALTVTVAFLSDVFDGVIARRGNAVTPGLRRADSLTDIAFYVAVAGTAWTWYRPLVLPWATGIAFVLAGEVLNNGIALLKFRRDASYHAWTARVWGFTLFLAVIVLFGRGSSALLPIAILAGLIAQAEAIAITLTLRVWRTDVPNIRQAFRLRQSSSSSRKTY